jgi:hypothetical protein
MSTKRLPSLRTAPAAHELAGPGQPALGYWRPVPTPSAGSFTPAGTPALEIGDDLSFGNAFGGQHLLEAGCSLPQCGPLRFGASSPGRETIADGIAVPRNGERFVALQ